jgi:Cdc6-like AAA superfamily ATPase
LKEKPNPKQGSPTKISAISADQLRRTFNPENLSFSSTEELRALDEVIGQGRAEGAIAFGIDIESSGYNIYALGPVGTGKTTTIRKYLERKAKDQPVPDDWLYVNNFEDSDKPRALRLPAGIGCQFQKDMERLVENLETNVPNAFEGEEYQKEQERIQEKLQESREQVFENLEGKAQEKNFTFKSDR